MSNSLVTVLCAGAICSAIVGYLNTMEVLFAVALAVAIWNNIQWAKVFKAATKVLAAKK